MVTAMVRTDPEQVITARIRRMREANVFTGVCLLTGGRGLPPGLWSQVLSRGVPPSSVTGPVQSPVPGPSRGEEGGTPVLVRGTPTPYTRERVLAPRGGRYASCCHAVGLSCEINLIL